MLQAISPLATLTFKLLDETQPCGADLNPVARVDALHGWRNKVEHSILQLVALQRDVQIGSARCANGLYI